MAELLSRAFGGKDKKSSSDARIPQTKEEAMAAFAGVFGS